MTRAEGARGVKDEWTEGVSASHLCENLETLTWQLGNQLLESISLRDALQGEMCQKLVGFYM